MEAPLPLSHCIDSFAKGGRSGPAASALPFSSLLAKGMKANVILSLSPLDRGMLVNPSFPLTIWRFSPSTAETLVADEGW